jgi:peptidyl-prolyl cis-trans isomerase C
MQIINAAPESEVKQEQNSCASHGLEGVQNPAANFTDLKQHSYQKEFGYQPLNKDEIAPEVPEITVNGVLISESEVLAEAQHHPAETKRQALVKSAESIIVGELLLQKAKKLGLLAEDVHKNSVEEAAALSQLLEQEVPIPCASEAECQRFFVANRDKFATSPLLEVRHILLAVPPDDITERCNLKEVADKLLDVLKAEPSSFDELVKRHSACPSKAQQGNLGQITKGQTVPEFEKALFAAQQGLISYPVESRYGFHIVFVDRKVDGQQLPYDYVKDKVAEYLNDKVQRKATAHYIQTLIQDADIKGFTFDIQEGLMQ